MCYLIELPLFQSIPRLTQYHLCHSMLSIIHSIGCHHRACTASPATKWWRHIWVPRWHHHDNGDLDNGSQTDASLGYLMTSQNVSHIQVMTDVTMMTVALTAQCKCTAGPIASPHRPKLCRQAWGVKPLHLHRWCYSQPTKLTHQSGINIHHHGCLLVDAFSSSSILKFFMFNLCSSLHFAYHNILIIGLQVAVKEELH